MLNRYNIEKYSKYNTVAELLWKSHQAVKKYFIYHKKDINNIVDLKDYFKKEYNKKLIKDIKEILI